MCVSRQGRRNGAERTVGEGSRRRTEREDRRVEEGGTGVTFEARGGCGPRRFETGDGRRPPGVAVEAEAAAVAGVGTAEAGAAEVEEERWSHPTTES